MDDSPFKWASFSINMFSCITCLYWWVMFNLMCIYSTQFAFMYVYTSTVCSLRSSTGFCINCALGTLGYPCETFYKNEVSCRRAYLSPLLGLKMSLWLEGTQTVHSFGLWIFPTVFPSAFAPLAVYAFVWMQVRGLNQSCPVNEWPNVRKCNSPPLCCCAAASPERSIKRTHRRYTRTHLCPAEPSWVLSLFNSAEALLWTVQAWLQAEVSRASWTASMCA